MLALGFVVVACTPQVQQQATDVLTEESDDAMENKKDGEAMMDDGDAMKKDGEAMKDDVMKDGDAMEGDGEVMKKEDGTSMKVPAPGVDPDSVDEMIVNENGDAMEMKFDYQANLVDVSGGSASGTATASFKDGQYTLTANFSNLPDPTGTDFYEGWLVRNKPLDVISTGRVNKVSGEYVNNFNDSRDLIDHDFYVLTTEPDDGDPAPAAHILEGTLTKN